MQVPADSLCEGAYWYHYRVLGAVAGIDLNMRHAWCAQAIYNHFSQLYSSLAPPEKKDLSIDQVLQGQAC